MLSSEKLLASLKRHNPAKVRAYSGDDEHRDIAVPTRRKKWSQVIAAIEGSSWSRVELLDKSNGVIAYVDNTDPAVELQELQTGNGTAAQVERLLGIVIRAQTQAMQYRDAEVQALLRAQGEVVKELTNGVRALSTMYQEQLSTLRETEAMRLEAQVPRDDMQQLMEALPVIIQALPALKSLLPSSKPKNGA